MKGSNFKYVCKECGHEETKWAGKCPECGSWNSFEEVEAASVSVSNPNTTVIDTTVRKLSDIPYEKTHVVLPFLVCLPSLQSFRLPILEEVSWGLKIHSVLSFLFSKAG